MINLIIEYNHNRYLDIQYNVSQMIHNESHVDDNEDVDIISKYAMIINEIWNIK